MAPEVLSPSGAPDASWETGAGRTEGRAGRPQDALWSAGLGIAVSGTTATARPNTDAWTASTSAGVATSASSGRRRRNEPIQNRLPETRLLHLLHLLACSVSAALLVNVLVDAAKGERQMKDIELSWQSTPRLWMAYRKGQCFCEDCRHKVPVGLAGTELGAILDLAEKEAERRD